MEPRIQYAKTSDGVSIAYDVMGSGPPLVWVSPIWASHLSVTWRNPGTRAVIEDLAADFTLVRYDGRGSGLSQREPLDFSLEARLRDLEAVIERTQTGSFALMGGLTTGAAAITYAARHPDRVSALILNNTYASGRRFLQETPGGRFAVALQEITEEQWDSVTLAISHVTFGAADPEAAAHLAEILRVSMTPDALLSLRDATRRIDVAPLLREVRVPTLVLYHENPLAPLALSQELASGIANARLVVFSDPPGLLFGDNARAAIRAFLGATPRASPVETSALAAPSAGPGLVSILWTDIVGHTEMMSRLGDRRGRDVLREHERITRDALKAHGGSEIKTMGDGFMASFGSATRALECAIAIQKAIAAEDRDVGGDAPAGRLYAKAVRVRIGLNAGEPIAEDDPGGRGDLFGTAVIVAARIAAQAQGGEILVSDVVRQLVAGKGFLFNDRGERALKGFEEPVRVWAVRTEA
jgi:class 3 adenylate cyclase/pimeloyl-ACP methyl ester carboxylesterase